MKEPKRLLEGDELPASVRDGLRLLGQATARPDDLARVQSALEQLSKTAPSGGGLGSGGAGLSTTTLIASAATIVVTAAIVAVRYFGPAPVRAPATSTAAPLHEVNKDARLTPPARPTEASASAVGETAEVQVEQPAHAQLPPGRSDERARTESIARKQRIRAHELDGRMRRVASARSDTSALDTTAALAVSTGSYVDSPAARPAAEADSEKPQAREPEATPTAPKAEPQLPRAAAAKPAANERASGPSFAVGSEAELLYRAKRLGTQDAAAALQLLAGLAARFPEGAFTEEREVLAIKLHEQLGHTEQAQALAASFRARFPHSMYRNAILP